MNALSVLNRGPFRNGDGRQAARGLAPFSTFHHEMDQILGEVLNGFGFTPTNRGTAGWPVVEVHELDDAFTVTAELPGLEQGDVEVTFREDVLTLKGERKPSQNTALYSERWAGAFERHITVSPHVDADGIRATFKNGVLTVSLPKKPELQPRRIRVE